ncbi:unconventional myosin-X [Strongylocentrotus purpuratus]|uniref:Myosin motor domain-containing protein n=1 Tax=Strongylocentrotus purpuratus TaxID=7668 RepID=A0A7M7NSE6_STRPU|nr:unconventional myosin-X [Strongylocentrotus purpuratus]
MIVILNFIIIIIICNIIIIIVVVILTIIIVVVVIAFIIITIIAIIIIVVVVIAIIIVIIIIIIISVSEVQVLKEQLRVLSAEMTSLRQALGFHQRPLPGSHSRHVINNQDSGYSDNLAESLSASSSISSASSTTSSTAPNSSSYSVSCSCLSSAANQQRRTPPLTSDLYGRLNDLVKMPRPVAEESVCKALQQRWMCGECQTKIGPIIIALNPHRGLSQDQVLEHSQPSQYPHLQKLAQRVHAQLVEQRRPQAVILSGESGSGKTYTSQLFLRQLHSLCKKRQTGGPLDQTENKQFQNLTNAFHVLRAVGCAKTRHNSCASRLGHHVEVHFAGNTITRTKFQCHWFDQSRVVDTPVGERNFHVFYQVLAGLSHEERAKLHLHGYGVHNLAYLKQRTSPENEGVEKERFHTLKVALSTLGIEFLDVMRILAAILLLGNVHFVDDGGYELDIKGSNEIKAVASLLGVPGVSLYRALTTRTHTLKGQAVKTLCNADQANETRDTLAKALYCRMVLSVVKRINSVFKPNSKCPPYVAPSISSEDTQSSGDSCSRLSDSTMELNGSSSLTEGSRHLEGTVHIIDMPGFSNTQCNRIEDLCCNYSSEVLHQVYLQQTFKNSQDAGREDRLVMNPVPFQDNISCVDFCASKNGLFSSIDAMCNQPEQHTVDELLSRTNKKHKNGVFAVERENKHLFTIRHTSGEVRYSAADFLKRSRDVISDDVLTIFRRKGCSFGFASYLFAPELKLLQGKAVKGLLFRICPRPHLSTQSHHILSDPSIGSLPIDSHHRLSELRDSLTRQQAQFHFIQCIKINDQESSSQFSYAVVARQTQAFQLMATIKHMTDGYPHYDTIDNFVRRYQMMLERWQRNKTPRDQCKVILEQIMRRCELIESVSTQNKWIISENRVFFSEETRQGLESVRDGHRDTAARFLQSKVRCWLARRHWPSDIDPYEECREHHVTKISFREPLYERINFSVGDNSSVMSDDTSSIECKKARMQNRVYDTAKEDVPPPLPSNHPSSAKIDTAKGFPQTRIMRCNYSPDISCVEPLLRAGEPILVMGVSSTKDILIVEHNNCTLQVPLKLTTTQTGDCILGTRL